MRGPIALGLEHGFKFTAWLYRLYLKEKGKTMPTEKWPVNIPAARGTLRRATVYLVKTRPGCTEPAHYLTGETLGARQAIEIFVALDKLLEWARS